MPSENYQLFCNCMNQKPRIISEIGCNHKGDLAIAKEMIKISAQFCNADIVKFQKRNNKELLTTEEYNNPHPVQGNAYGETYGKHREFLEFTLEQHNELQEECKKYNVVYSTSVWDETSAKEITSMGIEMIKVPSAINTNFRVLNYLCENFMGKIHISLGMTKIEEEKEIMNIINSNSRMQDTVLYHCISSYPVENENLYLNEIIRLIDSYKDNKLHGIGFSGHHKGIAADIAALTMGATFFERHFTLDRTWKGTDHAASLEPDGLRKLVRDLKSINEALKFKPKEILDIEYFQRDKLKKIIS